MTAVLNRMDAIVTVTGSPDISYTYVEENGAYVYDLAINAVNVQSKESVEAWPVIIFKENKVRLDDTINIEAEKLSGIPITHIEIRSKIPPMRVVDQSFIPDEVTKIGQEYFIKNFLVHVDMYQRRPLGIPIEQCKMKLYISCKDSQEDVTFSLPDEKPCSEQTDTTTCRKSLNLCNGEIILSLVDFEDSEADCKLKKPVIHIDVPKEADEWKTGEKLNMMFWKVPENPQYENCWEKEISMLDKECFEHLIGANEVTIFTEYLPE
jgi:hypothetical protein